MLYLDYNSTIRDIFRQVEEISQHGLEELYDKDVEEGKRSYSEAIISAGLVSKEDLINILRGSLSCSFRTAILLSLVFALFTLVNTSDIKGV